MTKRSESPPGAPADFSPANKGGRVSPLVTMIAAAALVVLTVCAAGFTIWTMHDEVDRETRANLGKIALVVAEQTSQSFQSVDLILAQAAERIAADTAAIGTDSGVTQEFLADRLRTMAGVSNLILIGADGALVSRAVSLPSPPMSFSDREQFKHLRDNDDTTLFVSAPAINKVNGSWTLYLARRINGPKREFRGIIEAAVRLDHLEGFYRTIALSEGGTIALMRRDGVMLVRYPVSENKLGSSIGTEMMERDLVNSADLGGIWTRGISGVPRYVALATVRSYPLVIAVGMTAEVVLGGWRRQAMILLLGASGAVAGVLVLLFALAGQIRGIARSKVTLATQNLELERRGRELAHVNMQFDAALSNMSQGLCMFDEAKRLTVSNRRFREMYSLTEEQVRPGNTLPQIRESQQSISKSRSIDQSVNTIEMKPRETLRFSDGRVVSIKRTPTSDGGWVATHEDITERDLYEQRISHLAYHDVLTGLANRAKFKLQGDTALATAACQKGCINILLIDLDRFKAVNDTFGHGAGDKLLQLAAQRMGENVRSNDVVARLGGDEFAIMQACETDQHEAAISLASRLIDVLGAPFDLDGHQATIGASIGIAPVSDRGTTVEQLMHQADLALYKAKAGGRNNYQVYESSMGQQDSERMLLESDLRTAISSDALELHYQPIVSLEDQRICAMEALVRWNHPTRGMLMADQFLPLAEDIGLVAPLGEFVIRRACLDAARWPDHIKVAVNISPTHIRRLTLMQAVTSALLAARIAPERLEIEVTETVSLRQDEGILVELRQLRNFGVAVALDDFGTGYSSLSYLRTFSFDSIKIDKSFVAEMAERSDSAAIVCAVAGLARSLDIETTAEGIETEEQMHLARAAGCVRGQGHLFGRPQPAAATLQLLFAECPLRQAL